METFYHTTKDGLRIKLQDLEQQHLENIIKFIERKADSGFVIKCGGGGQDIESMWYEELLYKGEEALEYLNHKQYVKELKKRKTL